MPRATNSSGPISAQAQQDQVSEGIDNFELPKALVTKIARSTIPDNAELQKDTVLSLVKGSTVFINYLAATAHDVAASKQHKSISASDMMKALEMMEFGDIVEQIQAELLVYRELAKTDKSKRGTSGIGGSSGGEGDPISPVSVSGSGTTGGGPAIIPPGVPGSGGTPNVDADGEGVSATKLKVRFTVPPTIKAKQGAAPASGKVGKKEKGKGKAREEDATVTNQGKKEVTNKSKKEKGVGIKEKGKGKAKEAAQPQPPVPAPADATISRDQLRLEEDEDEYAYETPDSAYADDHSDREDCLVS
ncbi:histone-fold-containing protein [Pluteus cervinus]|uniref:Histone-fold-containing protein n=1 Tax=Pluteus cervinus TaxID=181527 RepID=A0ACD3ARS7_9AGAR|nr:histone-fold-containing protein [Pluteus cervinus]